MNPPDRDRCADVLRRLDEFLDRELAEDEMELVRHHLEDCSVCAAEMRFEASVLNEMRSKLRRIAVPPALRDSVRRAIGRAARPEGGSEPGSSEP